MEEAYSTDSWKVKLSNNSKRISFNISNCKILFRAPHALPVILELTQLGPEEVDQIQLIHLEQADQVNQEYQGLSPYQNDLRISCPSGHQDHLKEPPLQGGISMQKVMSNHH